MNDDETSSVGEVMDDKSYVDDTNNDDTNINVNDNINNDTNTSERKVDVESSVKSNGRTESTVAQGTRFELKVTELLEAYGYKVQHNVLVKGTSGNEHQIDVVAEYKGPLHYDFLVVEAKAYSKGHNIIKEILMKQLNICNDIGYGGIMIFATSNFASGCITTANQYKHVKLINGELFDSLLRDVGLDADGTIDKKKHKPAYVKPHITKSKAEKHAKSRAKKMSGGMFGRRPKVAVKSVTLVCYPYHTIKYHHEKIEKKGIFSKIEIMRKIPHEVSVDARLGTVMNIEKHKLSYALSFIKDMKQDEIRLFMHANKKKMITPVETKASGVSKDVAASCMPRLHSLGYVSRLSMSDTSWKVNRVIPRVVKSIPQMYLKHMRDMPPGIPIPSTIPHGNAIQAISWLGDKVDSVTLTYYPYYDIRYEDVHETVYNEMLDAITGKEVTEIRDTMSEWKPRIGEAEKFTNVKTTDNNDVKTTDDENVETATNKNENTVKPDTEFDYINADNFEDLKAPENNENFSKDNFNGDGSKNYIDDMSEENENVTNTVDGATADDDDIKDNDDSARDFGADNAYINKYAEELDNDTMSTDDKYDQISTKQTDVEQQTYGNRDKESMNNERVDDNHDSNQGNDEQNITDSDDNKSPLDIKWSACTKIKSRFG